MKNYQVIIATGIVLTMLGFTNSDSDLKEIKMNVELGKANSIKTEITFTVGELTLQSGSNLISEGIYKFYKDNWKPNISYNEDSQTGYLKIETLDTREDKSYSDSDQNFWNVKLNKNIANNLKITMNGGVGNINLRNSKLNEFDFEMAAGQVKINLRNTSVPILFFKALAGNAAIDLSGVWQNNLNATIKGGTGELTLILPSDKGIKINIIGGTGDVNAPKFDNINNTYTNEFYRKTREGLYLDILGGVGDVNIQLADY